jgi:hypothetical protein
MLLINFSMLFFGIFQISSALQSFISIGIYSLTGYYIVLLFSRIILIFTIIVFTINAFSFYNIKLIYDSWFKKEKK